GIDAGARAIDRRIADIGTEDLDRDGGRAFAEKLEQRDRERIHLFAGGAARYPKAQRGVRLLVLDDARKDVRLERLEHFTVAEEPGDVDAETLVERVPPRRILLDKTEILGKVRDLVQHDPPQDAPPERRRLVVREIDVAHRPHPSEDAVQD